MAELSAVAGILGSLSAVLALFGPFGGGGASRSSVISTTPSSTPSVRHAPAISHDAQSTLLSKVPPGVRSTCLANDALRKRYGAVAAYHCSLPGADQVAYFTFRNNADLSRAYAPTPVHLGAGGCGKHWNVESGYHTPKSKVDVGSLKCYTHKGTAWIEWTRDDMLLYAYTSRSDGNRKQLFSAWNAAGPVP